MTIFYFRHGRYFGIYRGSIAAASIRDGTLSGFFFLFLVLAAGEVGMFVFLFLLLVLAAGKVGVFVFLFLLLVLAAGEVGMLFICFRFRALSAGEIAVLRIFHVMLF
jgi:hypothetical protein